MNKDVIYIDVEDDITAIIGKVKDSKEKIVAIVPPKRIGVLQSSVNLRLLTRAAKEHNKRLVLITSNSALISLAAAAKVPVAKTLQSKPELAEISALDVDDGEDVIDGSSLPVGELMKTADAKPEEVARDQAAESIARATPPAAGQTPAKPRAKSGVKVPNFNTFRKKLVLIGAGGALLLIFLIWAIFFAPHATVAIKARTNDSSVNAKVALGNAVSTSLTSGSIKTTTESTKKTASVDFDATGTKDIGEKAQGQVIFKNCEDEDNPVTIPAGTVITGNGRNYLVQTAVTVPKASISFTCTTPGTSSPVTVVAQDIGETYNIANGTTFSVAGHASSPPGPHLYAVSTTDMAGGSKRTAKVVSADDIQKATEQMVQQGSDAAKKQLKSQFDSSVAVIDQTFKGTPSEVKSAPALNEEAPSGKAKLTGTVTYTMTGVEKSEYSKFLDSYFAKQIEGKDDQRVYDNGAKKVTFTDVTPTADGFTARIVANAKIGPKIDDNAIKELAKGKRYGEVQAAIESIQGVDDVDVKFWPFWVSSVPNDAKKISIEFNLDESN